MPHPPHDLPSTQGYLVAAPAAPSRRRSARAWIAVGLVSAAVVAGGVAVVAVTAPPSAAAPSLTAPSATPEGSASPAASATPAPADAGATSLTGESAGGALLLELPDDGEPLGIAVFFPDTGTDAAAALAAPAAVALKDAGWALAAAASSPSGWASPAATADVAELLDWAAEHAPSSPMMVVADGAGAATSIAALGRSASLAPACWVGTAPVTDLMAQAQGDESVQAEILEAWGRVPDESELPRAFIDALSPETSYVVVSAPDDAPALITDDVATLVSSLEASGHDVDVVAGSETDSELLELAEGCAS